MIFSETGQTALRPSWYFYKYVSYSYFARPLLLFQIDDWENVGNFIYGDKFTYLCYVIWILY